MHSHPCTDINISNHENERKAIICLSVAEKKQNHFANDLHLFLTSSLHFFFLGGTQRNHLKVFFPSYLLCHNCIKLKWTSTINMLILNSSCPEELHSIILPTRKLFEGSFQLYFLQGTISLCLCEPVVKVIRICKYILRNTHPCFELGQSLL